MTAFSLTQNLCHGCWMVPSGNREQKNTLFRLAVDYSAVETLHGQCQGVMSSASNAHFQNYYTFLTLAC